MEKSNNYLYHICLNPAGVSSMQIIDVQADSIEGEEIFGLGAQGYIKLKLEGNTVGTILESPCGRMVEERGKRAITTSGSNYLDNRAPRYQPGKVRPDHAGIAPPRAHQVRPPNPSPGAKTSNRSNYQRHGRPARMHRAEQPLQLGMILFGITYPGVLVAPGPHGLGVTYRARLRPKFTSTS